MQYTINIILIRIDGSSCLFHAVRFKARGRLIELSLADYQHGPP